MEKIHFSDFPNFTPNLTPSEIFKFGSFGGTYWRPIHSSITGKNYQNIHTNYPKEWWYDIPENYLTNSWEDYDKYIDPHTYYQKWECHQSQHLTHNSQHLTPHLMT